MVEIKVRSLNGVLREMEEIHHKYGADLDIHISMKKGEYSSSEPIVLIKEAILVGSS